MARRVYWDACVFIGLINEEERKIVSTRDVWGEAKNGKTRIVTSTFTLTEVMRTRWEAGVTKPLDEADDKPIEQVLTQRFVERMILDEWLAGYARRLLRQHPQCKKPTDGIHLATALNQDVDEMHTWDGSDLLALDGKVQKRNGQPLIICTPRIIVAPPPMPDKDEVIGQGKLFVKE